MYRNVSVIPGEDFWIEGFPAAPLKMLLKYVWRDFRFFFVCAKLKRASPHLQRPKLKRAALPWTGEDVPQPVEFVRAQLAGEMGHTKETNFKSDFF